MTTTNDKQQYYNNMDWKPKLGTIYSIADKTTNKVNLFYQVITLKTTKINEDDGEFLHITYKVNDYRNGKNANIYYVKLNPLIINAKHKKRDLTIYFKKEHGESILATHTITDAKRPMIWKTAQDTKAITTKLNKLLINDIYLCKHNAFTSAYKVEDFYALYNILYDYHSPFTAFICPRYALYDKLCDGENEEYTYNEYTKKKFTEICDHNYIVDKLCSPNTDHDKDEYNGSENEEEEEQEEEEEEIKMC